MTDLQKILFPKEGICNSVDLYFRAGNSKVFFDTENQNLVFTKSDICEFNTYFNGFSIGKWRKYTQIKNVLLRLHYSGTFIITLYNDELLNNNIVHKITFQKKITSFGKKTELIPFDNFHQRGMHSFSLTALEDDSVFFGGAYATTDIFECNESSIALNICTYKKESFLYRNIARVEQAIIQNPSSVLYGKLHVYITDNAMSISEEKFTSPYIHILKQDAYGSAGGFTRGLVAILADKEKYQYGYTIFLDDDITLDAEVLERNYMFILSLKKEYSQAWVGGTMLGNTWPFMQIESGGRIEKDDYKSQGAFYDLDNLYFLLRNTIEETVRINAWWYCCIPLSTVSKNTLPYPMYFHCDDMEFCIRMCKKLILLNGICVWHDEFHFKKRNFYYDSRNREILYSLHYPAVVSIKKVCGRFIKKVLAQIFVYDYKAAQDIIDAYKDFCGGANKLLRIDERKKFKDSNSGLVPIDLRKYGLTEDDCSRIFITDRIGRKRRLISKLTLNGFLLPATHTAIVPICNYDRSKCYRAKQIIHYDVKTQKGYVGEKKILKTIYFSLKALCFSIYLICVYKFAVSSYRKSLARYTTLEFWKKHLSIETEE